MTRYISHQSGRICGLFWPASAPWISGWVSFPVATATAGFQSADFWSFGALMQPQRSRFSSLLCALHTSFVPAFKLTFFFSLRHFLLPVIFFGYPLQREGLAGRDTSWPARFTWRGPTQLSRGSFGSWAQPGGPTTWLTGSWATAGVTPRRQPAVPRQPAAQVGHGHHGSPCWAARFSQREGSRRGFVNRALPRTGRSASSSFHKALKDRLQHLGTDIWKGQTRTKKQL